MGSTNKSLKEHLPYYFLKKLFPYALYALLPILLIHFYFNPTQQFPYTNPTVILSNPPPQEILCDYSDGEWVSNKLGPLYNGSNCETIKPGQNCMVFGRPDLDYLKWKWKPKQCKLPRFEPKKFLQLLKNKHIAFVGDSLARNQLESLLCMLSTSSKPNLYYTDGEENKFRKWHFPSYKTNVSIYWSPFLVKGIEKNTEKIYNTLFLDSVDERWASDLKNIDLLVLSAGHWYLNPAIYYNGDSVIGCHLACENYTQTGFYEVFGQALKTTFETLIERKGHNGKPISVFYTTFSPAHFEGEWDKLGACSKTQPFKGNETVLDVFNADMRKIGVEEVRKAKLRIKKLGNSNIIRLEALDITKLAFFRPDGHPGPYMYPFPFANGVPERVQNDCVHWCLPGPIDTWNEILLDVIKKWVY
ncbi:hypothetical protein ACJIZ3_005102 [Penstemon smallii]|uniref:Trichome birefringence-like N-terminal domain-containing protein n=1 Tax=Penstemon smallii TaxID=265156 RepID=A0ABD3S430_9LAMI